MASFSSPVQAARGPLSRADIVTPGATGTYTVVGGVLTLVNGMINGWSLQDSDGRIASIVETSGSGAVISFNSIAGNVYVGTTSADAYRKAAAIYREVVGDFDLAVQFSAGTTVANKMVSVGGWWLGPAQGSAEGGCAMAAFGWTTGANGNHHLKGCVGNTVIATQVDDDVNASWSTKRWIRFNRSGGTLTAYRSTDGSSWTQVGQYASDWLPQKVRLGFSIVSVSSTADTITIYEVRPTYSPAP